MNKIAMDSLERARQDYVRAFQEHPLNKLKGDFPPQEINKKIGDALNDSKEWIAYQNAWIEVHGSKTIFAYDWDVDIKTRQRSFINSMYARKPKKSQDVTHE
jgi:hypothetical protein